MPPNSQWFPLASVQLNAICLAPGTFAVEPTPSVPYTPGWARELPPLIQSHSLLVGLNSHKSFRTPAPLVAESWPYPPKSQRLPLPSIQLTASSLPQGTLAALAVPCVP